jgi:hypothetical protein
LREDKVFQIFWKADQASKQDQRISRIRLAASSTSVTLGMVEIIAKIILGHRELLFNSFNLSTAGNPHVSFNGGKNYERRFDDLALER